MSFISTTDLTRRKRLADEPQGFHLEDDGASYNCLICHAQISGVSGWWDINGHKCLSCQKAIELGIIPSSVCTDRDSWFAFFELTDKYKISSSTISRLLREGKLKSRKIKALSGPTKFEVFLKQENEFLSNFKTK